MHDPRDPAGLVLDEIDQRRTSGYDVTGIDVSAASPVALLDQLAVLERVPDWPYVEPEDPSEIVASRRPTNYVSETDDDAIRDRIAGAWLGRCAGCLLGKPIETWPADVVERYLRATRQWPPDDYLTAIDTDRAGLPAFKPSWPRATRGGIAGMPRDDDIDYTVLGLHLLESHGPGFTTDDVGDELLDHLPFTQVFTAERVAYANLVAGLRPPDTARARNPYREWIGGLIRADIYGLTCPGDPAGAADLALRDASLSHTGNGVYAAMWAAGAIAAAVGGRGPRGAVLAGLSQVPPRSRLSGALEGVLGMHDEGVGWEDARERLHATYGHYAWVHAISNAAAIALAVLWGDGDLGRTIGLAVAAGWDTDSCGATAGSIAGAVSGRWSLPDRWVGPLADRVETALTGTPVAAISELADRTAALALETRIGGAA